MPLQNSPSHCTKCQSNRPHLLLSVQVDLSRADGEIRGFPTTPSSVSSSDARDDPRTEGSQSVPLPHFRQLGGHARLGGFAKSRVIFEQRWTRLAHARFHLVRGVLLWNWIFLRLTGQGLTAVSQGQHVLELVENHREWLTTMQAGCPVNGSSVILGLKNESDRSIFFQEPAGRCNANTAFKAPEPRRKRVPCTVFP